MHPPTFSLSIHIPSLVTLCLMPISFKICITFSLSVICSRSPNYPLLAQTCLCTNDLSDNQVRHKYLRKYIPHNGIYPCPRQFEYVCNLDTSLCVSPCVINALVRFRAFVYIVTNITTTIMSHIATTKKIIFQFILR